jgi:hypothetical protein
MIKILCNTLGITFEYLYDTAVGSSGALGLAKGSEELNSENLEIGTILSGILGRGESKGFQTVNIAGSLTTTNLDSGADV